MTREETISAIRQLCVKANPEIMELKPGCVLDLNCGESYGWMTIHQITNVCKKHKKYREECGIEENGCSNEEAMFGTSGYDEGWWTHTIKVADIKPHQIIGRPIRLADVLLVLFDTKGEAERGFILTVVADWNLRADTLDEQSDECVAFLAGLLEPGKNE
jgi:hypothetical protein